MSTTSYVFLEILEKDQYFLAGKSTLSGAMEGINEP